MSSLTLLISIDTLSSTPEAYHLSAKPEERADIAKRLKLLSLEQLKADLQLQKKGHIYLSGKIIADVTQQCVRTVVPLKEHLEIIVNEEFIHIPIEQEEEIEWDPESLAEPLHENTLDLGEIVIQLLSLNLNPYPVAPESTPIEYKEKDAPSPFEILKKKD